MLRIEATKGDIITHEAEVLVVSLFEGAKKPGGATREVDKALSNGITKLIAAKRFTGTLGEVAKVSGSSMIAAGEVWVLGLGPAHGFSAERLRKAFAEAVKKAKVHSEEITTMIHGAGIGGLTANEAAKAMTESALMATYEFGKYKSNPKENLLSKIVFIDADTGYVRAAEHGISAGLVVGNAVNFARDLVNEPPSHMTPTKLAKMAQGLESKHVKADVIGRSEALKLGMGAFLAVAAGSHEEPKFIHLHYAATGKSKRSVGLVGKAITFDSGGLNIKSESSQIHEMKMDMSGAAAVLGTFMALSHLKPKVEVHGFIAACENMPGGGAYRPGDIVKSLSGKTIEIANTDAEGRVTLADALTYAQRAPVTEIIDVATLTGACMVALGTDYAGVFGRPAGFVGSYMKAAERAGELTWQLPLSPEYRELNNSTWGDVKNSSSKRWGGAITAALFLEEFVDPKMPWLHVDIAGPAFSDADKNYVKKEGTGYGVRTLIEYLT